MIYAPLVPTPAMPDTPVIWGYEQMRFIAAQLTYVKVVIDVNTALALAEKSPLSSGMRLAVMKQVATTKEITLRQIQILFGWAANKALAASR